MMTAVFLDQGIAITRNFILKLFDQELTTVISKGSAINYKSQLQEAVHAQGQPTPVYHVTEVTGPAHERMFTVEVRVDDTILGRGSGKSKKLAETEAACSALEELDLT